MEPSTTQKPGQKLVTQETAEQIMRELGELGILTVPVKWPDKGLSERHLYQPFARGWATFAPWIDEPHIQAMGERIRARGLITLVDGDRAWTLVSAVRHTEALAGEVWEAGVFQGGSATLLRTLLEEEKAKPQPSSTRLRLFDSFEGLPQQNLGEDLHRKGDFSDTSLDRVKETVGERPWVDFHKGWIPQTFAGLESSRIRMAHVDVDLYQSILDCCDFIYPRLVPGAWMVFDDYGLASCPGARSAVDFFFRGRPEAPFPLVNGQCLVVRQPY